MVKRKNQDAEQHSRFIQFTIDHGPEPAFWMTHEGRFCYVNQAACSALGYSREELLALSIHDIDPNYSRETWDRRWSALKKNKRATTESHHKTKDGQIIPVEVKASFVEFEGREYGCAFAHDITPRKRAEEERIRLETQVRQVQKLESLGVLAGGIAHDFNNLLMAILGNADLALITLSPNSPVRHNVEEIAEASKRAADLCRQMLAYSGKGRMLVRNHDLSNIIGEMAQMIEAIVSKKAILRYDFAPDLPAVMVDESQMQQIILNLITNASEALGDTKGDITISNGVMHCNHDYLKQCYLSDHLDEGEYVYLQVSDTGAGMDNLTRDKIFDPFYTTKFVGRGLGLPAVLGIVRGHKGAIHVQSGPGQGTTIRVLLPVAAKEKSAQRPSAPNARASISKSILLIDDDPNVRQVSSEMLTLLGFTVMTAPNGPVGIDLFNHYKEAIDCVILDLTMPELSGLETMDVLRQIKKSVRVILSSGYNEQDATRQFRDKRLSGFIQKPYTIHMLRDALGQALLK